MKSGCGQRLMNQATDCKRSRIQLPLPAHMSLQVGDEVVLGVPQKAFIKASLMTFAMPLVVMLITAIIAQALSASEPVIALTALLGLGLGLSLVRLYSRSLSASNNTAASNQWQPVILRQQQAEGVQALRFSE
jgi:sigma-E factor negative regulatory protein RseC